MNVSENSRFDDDPRGYESSDFRVRAPIIGAGGMSYLAFMSIGEGGMARVYLAKARGPGGFEKLVVLKTIRRHALKNPSVRNLFVDEARLCAQLNHPNLVQVHDVDLDAESPCLVMEYLEGKSLNEVLLERALPPVMMLAVCSEVLAGLHYAHQLRSLEGELMNVVHRDVSPHNIFVTYDGAAKVLDFGIAKMAGAVSDTATEEVKGKLTYMAPEQLMGNEVDARADVFAVGVILWEIAMGRRMWDGVTQPVMMNSLATGEIPQLPPDAALDPELVSIIHRATAANPGARYPSALALRNDLDRYLAHQGRRPAMRDVGVSLAEAFAAERKKTAAIIRAALKERETVAPPVEYSSNEVPPRSHRSQSQHAARSGIWVLLVSLVFLVGVILVALSTSSSWRERIGLDAPDPGVPSAETIQLEVPSAPALPSSHRSIDLDEQEAAPDHAPARAGQDPSEIDSSQGDSTRTQRVKKWRPKTQTPPILDSTEPAFPQPSRPSPGATPQASGVNCNPPFYYKDGIKTYRPECL